MAVGRTQPSRAMACNFGASDVKRTANHLITSATSMRVSCIMNKSLETTSNAASRRRRKLINDPPPMPQEETRMAELILNGSSRIETALKSKEANCGSGTSKPMFEAALSSVGLSGWRRCKTHVVSCDWVVAWLTPR